MWSFSADGRNIFLWPSLKRMEPNYNCQPSFDKDIVGCLQTVNSWMQTASCNVSRPVIFKQVWCDVVCTELTLTSWCVTTVAFIVVDVVSEQSTRKICLTAVAQKFGSVFFGGGGTNATAIYITLKGICVHGREERNGKGFVPNLLSHFGSGWQ